MLRTYYCFNKCKRHAFKKASSNRLLGSLPKDVTKTLANAYQPCNVESGWYDWWESNKIFTSVGKSDCAPKFSMILPPPNITGNLHLGHALTCAIQDCLVSWNRMNGKTTTWIPGCDHAGIATQVVVEKNLRAQNTTREELGREKFLQEVWKWKDTKQDIIYQQLKTLGSSLDFSRSVFTMDKKMCYAVNEAFIRLHRSGKIYRKESIVNWSCHLQSAISDIEVDYKMVDGPKLIHVPGCEKPVTFGQIYEFAYKLLNSDEEVVVSTTRPETLLGDTAVAVHPEDSRFAKYIGKYVRHPIRLDAIPVIADCKVDREFGTGALKVTPGHDFNDLELAEKHGLRILNIFDNRGYLNIVNNNCSDFKGLQRFELREKMVDYLRDRGLLRKIAPHTMSVPVCSRSGDVIEPLLRAQWFVSTREMAKRAIDAVQNGELKIYPRNFENVWYDWLTNIKDWCVSRQLWWGHRIPAYHISSSSQLSTEWIVAHNIQQATASAEQLGLSSFSIQQDEDVLDTWFSSSLFPFAVCGWPNNTSDLQKVFPLNLMETGHDILFFWVARMTMMSMELVGTLPFKEVLLHGIICDSQGRKMSKSLGNVIDPMDVIHGAPLKKLEEQLHVSLQSGHISSEEFMKAKEEKRKIFPDGIPQIGADALRFTLLSYNIKNHFINLDVAVLKRNRLFCNKIWQSMRFLYLMLDRLPNNPNDSQCIDVFTSKEHSKNLLLINQWILSRLSAMVQRTNRGLKNYDLHHSTASLYDFFYGNLCDVYLEVIKPLTGKDQQESTFVLAKCFEIYLRCLSPFMPFLAEELYQRFHAKLASHLITCPRAESVLVARYPIDEEVIHWKNSEIDQSFQWTLQAVTELRGIKLQYNLTKTKPDAIVVFPSEQDDELSKHIITLAGLGSVTILKHNQPMDRCGNSFISRTSGEVSVHVNVTGLIDRQAELKKSYDKLTKLKENLAKLNNTISTDSYRKSAPLSVQESHNRKAETMLNEISLLEDYLRELSMLSKNLD